MTDLDGANQSDPPVDDAIDPRRSPSGCHDVLVGVAQQFGHPRGLLGSIVGRVMAKGNSDLSRWVVQQAASCLDREVRRAAELGPGPGVGLEALLGRFDQAQVWGVDLSSVMLGQARKRNRAAVASGRLTLVEGGATALAASAPADLVMANHVLYFWAHPEDEMSRIRSVLGTGGLLALGYQLKPHMPATAQRRFPPAGHRLYESDDEIARLAMAAGFGSVTHRVKGTPKKPKGRVALAVA